LKKSYTPAEHEAQMIWVDAIYKSLAAKQLVNAATTL